MMMMGPLQQQSSNPFGNPYGATIHPYGLGVPVQAYNPYTGQCFVQRTRSLSRNMGDYVRLYVEPGFARSVLGLTQFRSVQF